MLSINIRKNFKSINPCKFELPDFTVLTGLNGSGKSHLLEALLYPDLSEVFVDGVKAQNILHIPFNGLNPAIDENCDPQIITKFVKDFYNKFKVAKSQHKYTRDKTADALIASFYDISDRKVAQKYFANITIPIEDVDEKYLFTHFDISMMSKDYFFAGQFALIFKNYHKLLDENNVNRYYETQNIPITADILSDEDFNAKNGIPPWDFVNNILAGINVPYKVNSPLGTRAESTFEFKLISIDETYTISPQNLSTGEKVLMSLALAIYNSNGPINRPDLLVIDEPDAPLHPSMSKKMIEVLKNKIVIEAAIPVIMTSHSPTTIICCDGSSVFKMERGKSEPIKISVQEAVDTLSSDIPFLRISNDDRRQVFVESKHDVRCYELLTNILIRITSLNSSPIFIPARSSNGSNCTDVINIVTALHNHGNNDVYGIIDWDNANSSTDRIIVLGSNERYNIENYLLDPLLMGIYLLREGSVRYDEMGLNTYSSYSDFQSLNLSDCQKIIDYVLTKLGLDLTNPVAYLTFNENTLYVTQEFNVFQGHDLEAKYKDVFPFLNRFRQEPELKVEIINKVINDFPLYTPKELFNTILKIK